MKLENGRFSKITEIFAFISIDENGHEGIMAAYNDKLNTMMPLIGADIERVESLKPIADEISKHFGSKYEIRYFSINQKANNET